MHTLIWIGRLFPIIAIVVIFALVQIAIHFRRRADTKRLVFVVGIGGLLGLLTVLWIYFRGDMNSDRWVRDIFGGFV